MKRNWRTLLRPYQTALNQYLKRSSPARLKPALKLGDRAVALGLETLDLALIHEQALLNQVPSPSTPTVRERIIKRSRKFFASAIIAMEETHRSAVESNAHLIRLNKSLSRRTRDLAASNARLKNEVARRRVAEVTLRKSERHATQLLAQSQHLHEQMKLLSRRVLSVQEEERKRISRELHDVIAQMLSGINVRLTSLKLEAAANTKGLSQKISRTQKLVEKSVNIVHRFARELRPAVLDDLGLIPALHSFVKSFSGETGIRVHLRAFTGVEELSSAKRTVLYRITQEALSNVARHAFATHVEVNMQKLPGSVRMQIKDDGKGFDFERVTTAKKSKRLGLLGMRERVEMVGGTFTVDTKPGKGTTIRAEIPHNNGHNQKKRGDKHR